MVKRIIRYPDPSLRQKCREVKFPLSAEVKEHLIDLIDTLNAEPNGLALASNQILARGWRVFVVKQPSPLPVVVINPAWFPKSHDAGVVPEGCLSVPGLQVQVARRCEIRLAFQDEEGVREEIEVVDRLAAQAVQHEIDHLDGWLVVDALPFKKRAEFKAATIRERQRGK